MIQKVNVLLFIKSRVVNHSLVPELVSLVGREGSASQPASPSLCPRRSQLPAGHWEKLCSGVWLQTGTLGGCLWAGSKPDLGLLPVIFWGGAVGVAANKNNFILMNQMVRTGVSREEPGSLLPKLKVRAWSHTLYLWLLTPGSACQ